jgi:hypothetical protein
MARLRVLKVAFNYEHSVLTQCPKCGSDIELYTDKDEANIEGEMLFTIEKCGIVYPNVVCMNVECDFDARIRLRKNKTGG